MRLHGFFRSGTSHRLRIALNLKGLAYEQVAVDLRKEEHRQEAFRRLNPQQLVPALELDDGRVLIQSPAIIEWLEETHPLPALIPGSAAQRQRIRALAAIVACDVHPLNNRRVLEALRHDFGADADAIDRWCGAWIDSAFDALEALLAADTGRGRFCVGDAPTLADVCLVPQVESARRFQVDPGRWPRIAAVEAACLELDAFRRAAPMAQPDAA